MRRLHDATLYWAGIRSGHRIVKCLSVPPTMNPHGALVRCEPECEKQQLQHSLFIGESATRLDDFALRPDSVTPPGGSVDHPANFWRVVEKRHDLRLFPQTHGAYSKICLPPGLEFLQMLGLASRGRARDRPQVGDYLFAQLPRQVMHRHEMNDTVLHFAAVRRGYTFVGYRNPKHVYRQY
jgi:hypothetical protein